MRRLMSILGTLTLGLALLRGFPAVAAPATGEVACALSAFLSTRAESQVLELRSGPGRSHAVVGRIPPCVDGTIVRIRGARGGWVRITRATSVDDRIVFQGNGWLLASVLETATRGKASLRASPSEKSAAVATVAGQQTVRLRGASGRWAYVEHQGRRGWLAPADQCPNPVTTCP